MPSGSTAADLPLDADIEEVRLAMALNGGVSLSVWMGGVAVELDCARRAHAGEDPSVAGETRRIYAAITTALNRRLVIDIMSGASAGGLNGSLLAAAIRRGRRLNPAMLRGKWLEIGDFLLLLQPTNRRDPPDLMQGGRSPAEPGIFYRELRKMFAIVLGEQIDGVTADEIKESAPPDGQPPVSLDVSLDVMMTDVQGEPRWFRDYWGNNLAAREYRTPFRFRKDADFAIETLATAARASASFPFAFQPFLVQPPSAALAGFTGSRYAIDGGLLENAPIDAAIRMIPGRAASTEVKRFVCYLNAAPPTADAANPTPPDTTIENVAGWLFNVPRDARFVDQLYAIREAQRQASISRIGLSPLLLTPLAALSATAAALLPAYRERRLALSLQEISDDPAWVDERLAEAGPGAPMAWLPATLNVPQSAADWSFGVATAQRILYLELQFLRVALRAAPDASTRLTVLTARRDMYAQLALLRVEQQSLLAAARGAVAAAADGLGAIALSYEGFRAPIFTALTTATDSFLGVLEADFIATASDDQEHKDLAELRNALVTRESPETVTPRAWFLKRALAAEVIQRAFATSDDVAPAQELPFAQLTPLSPVRIFSSTPFADDTVPDSGAKKLTGTKLMHFSAFYRRSWRANDFMWGRLDGATRLVDLLVDSTRAAALAARGNAWISPGAILANAVLPPNTATAPHNAAGASDERHALVEEAFHDANREGSAVSAKVISGLSAFPVTPPERDLQRPTVASSDLRTTLAKAFDADLAAGDARFTRVVLSRALQAEILREEYGTICRESEGDAGLGAYAPPLPPAQTDPIAAINAIRSFYYEPPGSNKKPLTLPGALGLTDRDEPTSDLALRTVSRTMYAALAALRRTVILGNLLSVFRAPLLPMSGIVSARRAVRGATAVGFASACSYVLIRLLSATPRLATRSQGKTVYTENHPHLSTVWDPAWLLGLAALLVILGAIIVPGLRGLRADGSKRPWRKGLLVALTLGLIAFAVAVPVVAAWRGGHFGLEQLLGTPDAASLPAHGSAIILAIILGTPVLYAVSAGAIPGTAWLQALLDRFIPVSLIYAVISALVLAWSIWTITDHLAFNWRLWALAAASLAVILFAAYITDGIVRGPKKPLTVQPITRALLSSEDGVAHERLPAPRVAPRQQKAARLHHRDGNRR